MRSVQAAEAATLVAALRRIVGRRHVLTGAGATRRFRKGYRSGEGPALAVVRPGTLLEQWRVSAACVAAGRIVIVQAANTGLTGGSTPDGEDDDREIVIISTQRLRTIHLLDQGRQVVCLPGATLHALESLLATVDRAPHSVIGSSCIGASVIGGVCNNSGGALIRRGPAYTQCALFAQVDAAGGLVLVNHLGIRLGEEPEEILERLEQGRFDSGDVVDDPARACADAGYALPRHGRGWVERLPATIGDRISHRLYYGHFFCQVFHQDYIVRKGFDPAAIEHEMWDLLDARGAQYPAEHNVGHLYPAQPALAAHYRSLDPCNCLNPGIGQTSKAAHWR